MAAYLELEDCKDHLIVDFDDDNDYISGLMDVVEASVEIEIEDSLSDLEDEEGDLPAGLMHAMKLLLAHFYANREPLVMGVTVNEIPLTYKYLIAPFKNWVIGQDPEDE